MPNLKDIRNRITSVGSTMQITSAMKLVSAAKLKRATDSIVQLRPYADKLRELLQNVSSTLEAEVGGALTEEREVNKVLLVVINSNRGLCGGYNSSIIKKVNALLANELVGKHVEILAIGKKANDTFSKTQTIYKNASSIWDNLNFADVAEIADDLVEKFTAGDFDQIRIIYNQFQNAAVQIVQDEQFLPVVLEKTEEEANNSAELDYIFNPSKEEILRDLIPQTLKTQLFKAVLDANASEHGARMTAMHKATDNASELQKGLKIQYNKARQAAITNEILEIVGGAEALNA
ncbi:ATP synthase F1 subunit gamma [Empedobacter falsenii]|uniref:ATP synthase gamma chain n=1 Tax=Empedobacter falsenii TaxID=343874 RepID=A0A7H9DX85_9FLAO|nr:MULTISPECIES: ATP synthase F1 subunit gamma [Empedobacter]HCC94207.1 ATP synthase F1 subunit gamma [Flavobacteriaceae bacterium]MDH0658361.1 ATP synthase F1 subunit gamma [Empedobacter sp. GD03865]MDH2207014.1 ATP synthase F1 subunit gamma [Empedobacter sp. GD03644]MDM1042925.1 ATP synthase F1 subunit gamma [Empedobacter brevis]MDM1062811.1 ATP synthase F1 subunit gamma [Empedobacter falsenii]